MDIRIPRLGEGVSSGTVVSILVQEGDAVKKDQTVLELETEKAVAPIPSPGDGKVSKIHVQEGDAVPIGQLVISLAGSNGGGSATAAPAPEAKPAAPAVPAPQAPQAAPVAPQAPVQGYQSPGGFAPPASPSVRKVARDLGIDLTKVRGTEAGGRISLADLRDYVQYLQQATQGGAAPSAAPAVPAKPAPQSIDFSKWGSVNKKSLSSLRQKIGQKMLESWQSVPHVTQFDEADITELMALRKKHNPSYKKKNANLTVTVMILKTIVRILQKYPNFNSSIDEATGELVQKQYYHLGIAVDTEQGLIVPVLRDVDRKSVLDLSLELSELAEKTRQRKVSLDDLQGGTFTVSNLGSIGGQFFTPIVNKPEVAILGLARGIKKPVVTEEGKVEARMMLPIALSYDHRVIDGADGARFITELVQGIQNPDPKEFKI